MRQKKALPKRIIYLELLDSVFDADGGGWRARSRVSRDFPWLNDWRVERWGLRNPYRGRPREDVAPLHGFGLPFRRFPRVLLPVLVWIIQFVFSMLRPRAGIIVAYGPVMAAGVAAARLFRRSSILVIRIIESGSSRAERLYRHPIEAQVLKAIERFALRRASLVLPIGPFTSEIARRSGVPEDRILEVPFPIELNTDTDRSNSQEREGRVVAAARLVPEKGMDVLIIAFAQVADEIPSVSLEIAGGGPHRSELERLTKQLDLGERVKFLGHLPRDGMASFWGRGLVAVLPSRVEEGFPRVLVEAGLAECALVGTNLGGIKDIVIPGRTGLLVPPNDPDSLASALLTLLRQPDEARRLGAEARGNSLLYLARTHPAQDALRLRLESLCLPASSADSGQIGTQRPYRMTVESRRLEK